MRSLLRSFQEKLQAGFASVTQWVSAHKHPLGLGILMLCLMLLPHFAQATTITEDAVTAIIQLLAWVVQTLGKVFVFLVDIFLGFARYNGFGDAQPVQIGWVIVRDICNMFFIVILLISAFSTIIGWDSSLRYNAVLPKLLLMAILINFSRTLIQLLIDFSQVVMLTFVNAFRSAGAGNFTAAFRINQLMSMGESYTSGAAPETNLLAQVFASFLLALVLIVIANGVMLIMIAYVLGRIVLLWMMLILSPAAFFVTALPSRLQSGMASLSGKYWSRLAGVLTGGPVVMFFIYLTFAVLQSPPANPPTAPTNEAGQVGGSVALDNGQQNLARQLNLYTPTADINGVNATNFLTRVGTSDNVASFIIAVALMLMALEAAMEAANAVDSSVGQFAQKIGSASKGLAFGAASLAAASPFLAAKFLGVGAARALDRRYDVTGKASGLALRVTNRIPIVGQYARKPLMAGMTMRKREAEQTESELLSATKGMTAEQKAIVQAGGQSLIGGALNSLANKAVNALPEGSLARDAASAVNKRLGGAWYTQGDKMAFQALALDLASNAVDAEQRTPLEDELAASIGRDSAFDPVNKAGHTGKMADALANDRLLEQKRANLDIAQQKATQLGDQATLDRIKEERKNNPLLISSPEKFASEIKKKVENPEKFAKMDASAKSDVRVIIEGLKAAGVVEQVGDEMVLTGDDAKREAYLNSLSKADKTMHGNTDFVLDYLDNNKLASGKNGMKLAETSASRLEADGNGNMRMWRNPSSKLGTDDLAKAVSGGLMMRNSKEASSFTDLKGRTAVQMATPAAGNALRDFLEAGGRISDVQTIPGIKQAMAQFTQSIATKMNSVLEFDGNQLNVKSGQEADFRELMKQLRPLLSQSGQRGLDQSFVTGILDSMQQNITVTNTGPAGGTETMALADVGMYKSTYNTLTSTKTKKALVELFSTANDLSHTPTLENASKLYSSTDRKVRDRVSPVIGRVIEGSLDS